MSINNDKVILPSYFPKELFNTANSLKHLGISDVAWDWQNAIKVIMLIYKSNHAVLGGDIYRMTNAGLTSTYDSWYFNQANAKSWHEYVAESKDKAISYIKKYHNINGEDFYYSVIFTD